MKYFLFNPANQAITGPFELDDIEAKLKAGELSADTRATGDIGESLRQVRSTPAEDWMPVQSIPGFGLERGPESTPPAAAGEIRFCPGCAHELLKPLPPGKAGVCERCGRTLGSAPPPPPAPQPKVALLPAQVTKSGGVLAGIGKALGAAFMILVALVGGLMLLAFLVFVLLLSQCRA